MSRFILEEYNKNFYGHYEVEILKFLMILNPSKKLQIFYTSILP
jgi:hypothetical protein